MKKHTRRVSTTKSKAKSWNKIKASNRSLKHPLMIRALGVMGDTWQMVRIRTKAGVAINNMDAFNRIVRVIKYNLFLLSDYNMRLKEAQDLLVALRRISRFGPTNNIRSAAREARLIFLVFKRVERTWRS